MNRVVSCCEVSGPAFLATLLFASKTLSLRDSKKVRYGMIFCVLKTVYKDKRSDPDRLGCLSDEGTSSIIIRLSNSEDRSIVSSFLKAYLITSFSGNILSGQNQHLTNRVIVFESVIARSFLHCLSPSRLSRSIRFWVTPDHDSHNATVPLIFQNASQRPKKRGRRLPPHTERRLFETF